MSPRPFPTGVYLIADAASLPPGRLVPAVGGACAAGIRLVQYRNKSPLSQDLLDEAEALCALVHAHGGVFIVNDRADVARMVAADGVHVGQDDLSVAACRAVLGAGAFIGVSTHSVAEARRASDEGADYVGFGAVFGTVTKTDAQGPWGCERLAEVCRVVRVPVYAIGGIGADNLHQVALAGAAGAAVVSAVLGAEDAGQAAAHLVTVWAQGVRNRCPPSSG